MELLGVAAAVLSSALGGTAVGATRYLVSSLDPFTIGAIRFAGGFAILACLAALRHDPWPRATDLPANIGLGVLFYGLFPLLFNAALIYTTAARGALALTSAPVLTMAVGGLLGIERPTPRKIVGMLVAMAGVLLALGGSLSTAAPAAWIGDVLMCGAALCMAFYNVWSRPFVVRSAPIPFAAFGMACGTACLALVSLLHDGPAQLASLDSMQWIASGYLTVVCGAFIFFLWAFALGRTPPSLVGLSVAINPVTAAIFGQTLLGERIDPNLAFGLAAVITGIAIASTSSKRSFA
jgi:drug/metabolite transporter (DMT)-like permease